MSALTYTDGPLTGLGIRIFECEIRPQSEIGYITYAVGSNPDAHRLKAQAFTVTSEPTRRAVREKVARGIAKLFYRIRANQDVRFGRGVPVMQFTVSMAGTTPGCKVDYHFSLTIDEILGVRQ